MLMGFCCNSKGTKLNDSAIEVTVRSRVFAPHKRGLQYITVQGFVMEYVGAPRGPLHAGALHVWGGRRSV